MVKLKYMFIDESGDLGFSKKSSKYFIISAILVEETQSLSRIIKNMRRNKFKKELKKVNELKANNSSDAVRIHLLEKLNSLKDLQIFHIVLKKKKLKSKFLLDDKHKLYNFIAGKLAKNILLFDTDLEIRIDKTKGKIFLQKDFDNYFTKLLNDGSKNIKCTINHSYSHNFDGLQIVDFVVWSIYQKFERENSNFNDVLNITQEVYFVW